MFPVFFGRVVSLWKLLLGVLIAAVPAIAYVFGRKDGRAIETKKVIEDAAQSEKERADFYKRMGEASNEAQNNRPADRAELAERLRRNGL